MDLRSTVAEAMVLYRNDNFTHPVHEHDRLEADIAIAVIRDALLSDEALDAAHGLDGVEALEAAMIAAGLTEQEASND